MTRKNPRETDPPLRNNELDDFTADDLRHFNGKYTPLLMAKIRAKAKQNPELDDVLFSKRIKSRVFNDKTLPPPKELVSLCRILDCSITFILKPYRDRIQRETKSLTIKGTLQMSEMLRFMYQAHGSKRQTDSRQMIAFRERTLKQLEEMDSHLHLTTLLRFFNACGYQAAISINEIAADEC